jgi:hypothetical protein
MILKTRRLKGEFSFNSGAIQEFFCSAYPRAFMTNELRPIRQPLQTPLS